MESRQEVATPQSLSKFDVTREVSKEELPVCVPPSFSAKQEPSILKKQQDGVIHVQENKKEREEDLLGKKYIPPSQSSSSSSSPSPHLRYPQPAMSRIYNLKPVTSRAGVCVTERNLGVQTHSGGITKSRPGGQVSSGAQKISAEVSSLRSVQRQVEQLHLKDHEVRKQNNGEALQKPNICQDQNINIQKDQTHVLSKPSSEPRVQTQLPQISTSTPESMNTQTEPNVTTPSTRLFTIRSASGGPGKRGTTITITPRKTGPSGMPSSSDTKPNVPSSSVTTPKAPSNTREPNKKRYPTAEEIEVIGGYQNLERSCLLKNRGSPKIESVVKEEGNNDDWSGTEEKKEENDEEEEDEDGAGSGIKRVLRVAGPTVKPSVSLLPPSSLQPSDRSASLLCLLSAYSPQGALVSWTVDSSEVKDGVLTSPEEQKKDGYTRSSTLTLSKELWEKGEEFVCTVSHGGVHHPLTFRKSQC
ncbi:phostensin [Silurus asotus]|uniref:Phostensin n=1 Tax=Silurus asotus TaxID=30991 RepID=A0AAD5FTV5_SILAS|nr:phostensin [Silurus asotus]